MYAEDKTLQLCSRPLSHYGDDVLADLLNFYSPRDPLGSYRNIDAAMRLHTACRVGVRTKNDKLLQTCLERFYKFLDASLFRDGSTFEYRDHHSLFHHLECVLFLFDICHLLETSLSCGRLHLMLNQHNACLVDAVFFVLPFLHGEKFNIPFKYSTHREERRLCTEQVWVPEPDTFLFQYLQREYPEVVVPFQNIIVPVKK